MTDCLKPITDCDQCTFGRHSPMGSCSFKASAHAEGTRIFAQGEELEHVYFVRQGVVLLSGCDTEGTERLCRLRSVGGMFGWEALLHVNSEYSATALTPVQVCSLRVGGSQPTDMYHPSLLKALLTVAAAEIQGANQENWLLRGSALSRLARFLLERRRHDLSSHPLTIERKLLARLLGVRAETLCRAEKKLRELGVVSHGRNMFIADPNRLARIAEESDAN